MTQYQQILSGLKAIGGRGTCGQIAAEIRLSRKDVECKISQLVRAGKVRVADPKGSYTINHRQANVYCINTVPITADQTKLF